MKTAEILDLKFARELRLNGADCNASEEGQQQFDGCDLLA
jgi:hypothetical protein